MAKILVGSHRRESFAKDYSESVRRTQGYSETVEYKTKNNTYVRKSGSKPFNTDAILKQAEKPNWKPKLSKSQNS